jgi:3-deoxy-manno-octulosonate cytidylyltransferase (CMP-KDO synthetase)
LLQGISLTGGPETRQSQHAEPERKSASLRAAVVIPARYHSTRLPGKMLLSETGKYLVEHVYEQALKARLPQEVVIATDDDRVLSAAASFGARAVRTRRDHRTGTERVAEAAAGLDAQIIVNLQGDEPLIAPDVIDSLVEALRADETVHVATAAFRFTDPQRAANPNLVKVVVDNSGDALYFSRSPVPCYRDEGGERIYLGHLGIYAYRRDFLEKLVRMGQTRLEAAEKLEQLRVLENGYSIRVVLTGCAGIGIDTREDYDRFVQEWRRRAPQG